LYIHWNKINGPSTQLIFEKLQSNNNLQVFDYSHNIISQGPSVASAIA
jgi:Ran GTPase-activating protein (RanGAP) involved in mRNA processing and transport